MSFAQCPKNRGLSRDALKWLQSLDLSSHPKNVRRDFSNGFLVAEIFSHYYPQDFPVQTYNKGTSLTAKQKNWSRIERALEKQNRYLVKELVDGTIHCKPGAAELLVHEVYSILTNQSIKAVQSPVTDFTDQDYQVLLPALARSTASKAITNNLRQTEIMAEPNINTIRRKAEVILHRHREHKAAERMLSPERFKAKPLRQLVVPSSQGNEHFDSPAVVLSISMERNCCSLQGDKAYVTQCNAAPLPSSLSYARLQQQMAAETSSMFGQTSVGGSAAPEDNVCIRSLLDLLFIRCR